MANNTLICMYHGFTETCKIVIPKYDFSKTIKIDNLEEILDYIKYYNINLAILSGLPMVMDPVAEMITLNCPDTIVQIGEL